MRDGGRLTPGALRPPPVARRQFEDTPPPERVSFEVPSERRKRVKEAKRKEEEAKQAKALEECAWPRPRPGLPGAGPVDGKPTLGRRAGKPNENSDATEDAYKTIFVGRLSFETTESKLRREFGEFGEIKSVRPACRARASASDAAPTPPPQIKIVHDKEQKPRGYAFIEFENERDMKVRCPGSGQEERGLSRRPC